MSGKLWVLSDLHLDYNRGSHLGRLEPPAGADIAVLAGDIVDPRFVERIAARLPTIYVAGNHEFYGGYIRETAEALASLPGVTFLNDDIVRIDGIRFIGGTLWTDYALRGREWTRTAMDHARNLMNDHRRISNRKQPWSRFLPADALHLHEKTRRFIDEAPLDDGSPVVVVTHHAPHPGSLLPQGNPDD
ncbi:metallophosphoesterase, partial [Methylobrevis pamukkalensis]|uniref:metallophosphoesterase n=1 Tax=Methylobrevis pamukkalensis TaxID=1439726 RepID=UPI000AB8E25E